MIAIDRYSYKDEIGNNPIGFRVWDLNLKKWKYAPDSDSAQLKSWGLTFHPKSHELISFNTHVPDSQGICIYEGDVLYYGLNYYAVGSRCHSRHLFFYNLEDRDSMGYNGNVINLYLDNRVGIGSQIVGDIFTNQVRAIPRPAPVLRFNAQTARPATIPVAIPTVNHVRQFGELQSIDDF